MGRNYRRFGIHLCVRQRESSCTGSYDIHHISCQEVVEQLINPSFILSRRSSNPMVHLWVNSAHAERAKEILSIHIILPCRIRIALSFPIRIIIAYKSLMWMDEFYLHSALKVPKKDNSNSHGKIASILKIKKNWIISKLMKNDFVLCTGVLLSTTKDTSVSPIRATIASKSFIRMAAFCVRLDRGVRAMLNSKDWKVLLSCRMEIS